jgi:hypothetical protein
MTMKESVCLTRGFALAIVLGALSAGAAQAQYSARVTLPHEVRWGGAILPAGEYRLAMESISRPLQVIDASGRVRVYALGTPDAPTKTQPDSLLITRDGAERTVRSLNLPVWDRKFVFKPFTRAERSLLASGERTEAVPVRTASR